MDARLMSTDTALPSVRTSPLNMAERAGPWLRVGLILSIFWSCGATYSTPNFVVTAPTAEFAKQVGDLAEQYREQIAIEWTGEKLPRWYKPCPISVKVGQLGAGGATSFCFDRGHVFGWKMNIQGTEERILDSVLPHEVSHTIFACYFRRPLPRWADEGAATLVEHESERMRQQMLLDQVIRTSKRIPLKQLLSMKEYPKEMQQVLTLYAEGYSLANFLVQQGGKTRYLNFLQDAHDRNWDEAIAKHYGLKNTENLEKEWTGWIMAGSPPLPRRDGTQLADAGKPRKSNEPVVRLQSPDESAADHLAAPPRSDRGRDRGVAQSARTADATNAGRGNARGSNWDTLPERERLPRPTPLASNVVVSAGSAPPSDSRTRPQFDETLESVSRRFVIPAIDEWLNGPAVAEVP
ncbi:MAG: hypothetical protein IT428_26385 [Planctomycetaceae bacterium]|nr:hypothetical protein [Planctomycetaceae bacterium]